MTSLREEIVRIQTEILDLWQTTVSCQRKSFLYLSPPRQTDRAVIR